MTITLAIGEQVAQSIQYSNSHRIVTITGVTKGGNYKTSDGAIYYPPTAFQHRPDDWSASQRSGDTWGKQSIFKLTDERRENIEIHRMRREIDKIRNSISTPPTTKEQAERLLRAWREVADIVASIKGDA